MESYDYRRVLIKLSGETLKGVLAHGYDAEAVGRVVKIIGAALDQGVEIALVVGAGNVWRGVMGTQWGLDRVTADLMGMTATIMNALCLRDAFNSAGFSAEIQSALPLGAVTPPYNRDAAIQQLQEGKVVIFAGGTGSPFFTTDTTAALRALETDCQAILKATKVDGVYTDDPMKNSDVERYEELSFDEALDRQLAVMDATAFSLCRENQLPIVVFNFFAEDSLDKALRGDVANATIIK